MRSPAKQPGTPWNAGVRGCYYWKSDGWRQVSSLHDNSNPDSQAGIWYSVHSFSKLYFPQRLQSIEKVWLMHVLHKWTLSVRPTEFGKFNFLKVESVPLAFPTVCIFNREKMLFIKTMVKTVLTVLTVSRCWGWRVNGVNLNTDLHT